MIVLVLPAAALGGLVRWWLAERFNSRQNIPLGTLTANLVASFAIGLLAGLDSTSDVVVRVGLLGALSTWSTLANEVLELYRHDRRRSAVIYLAVSLVGGVASAWLGLQFTGN